MRYVHCNVDDEDVIKVAMKKGRIINRYPSAKKLSHKDTFSRYMKLCCDMAPDGYEFVPPQFEYPKEAKKLVEDMKSRKNALYIAKP